MVRGRCRCVVRYLLSSNSIMVMDPDRARCHWLCARPDQARPDQARPGRTGAMFQGIRAFEGVEWLPTLKISRLQPPQSKALVCLWCGTDHGPGPGPVISWSCSGLDMSRLGQSDGNFRAGSHLTSGLVNKLISVPKSFLCQQSILTPKPNGAKFSLSVSRQ